MADAKPAPLLDEVFDELEKKYKTPSPEAVGMHASAFERNLHRYLLLFLGSNACIWGLLALAQVRDVSPALVPSAALLVAIVIAALYRRSASSPAFPATLTGTALTLLLLTALSLKPLLFGDALAIALSGGVIALILQERLPQVSVAFMAVYLPGLLAALGERFLTERIAVEALILLPMLAVFIWRRLKVAALSTLAGAVLAGAGALIEAQPGYVGAAALIGVFVAAAVIYEVRVHIARSSTLREVLALGVPVVLIYLFVWSLDLAMSLFASGGGLMWWTSAAIVVAYQGIRVRQDAGSLPVRLALAAASLSAAVLIEPGMHEYWKMLALLGIATVLQVMGIQRSSALLTRFAMLIFVSVALYSLNVGTGHYGVSVLMIASLTFAALVLLPRTPKPAPVATSAKEQLSLLRRVGLVVFGTLLRVPFIGWGFFWAKTLFTWLRYFKSSDEPLGVGDLLFAFAQVYAVLILSAQLVLYLRVAGFDSEICALASVFLSAAWGVALVIQGIRRADIYRRMLGITLVVGGPLASVVASSANGKLFYGWLLLGVGLATWVGSWLVLQLVADRRGEAAASLQAAAGPNTPLED